MGKNPNIEPYKGQMGRQAAGLARLEPRIDDSVLATVPADTRTITGRAFGDPLPGRSALDRKMAKTTGAQA